MPLVRYYKPQSRVKWLPVDKGVSQFHQRESYSTIRFLSPSLFKFWMQAHSAWMAEPIPQFSHIHFPLARFFNWKWKCSMKSWNKKLISMASREHDTQTVLWSWKTFSHWTKMCSLSPATLTVMSWDWDYMSQECFLEQCNHFLTAVCSKYSFWRLVPKREVFTKSGKHYILAKISLTVYIIYFHLSCINLSLSRSHSLK